MPGSLGASIIVFKRVLLIELLILIDNPVEHTVAKCWETQDYRLVVQNYICSINNELIPIVEQFIKDYIYYLLLTPMPQEIHL